MSATQRQPASSRSMSRLLALTVLLTPRPTEAVRRIWRLPARWTKIAVPLVEHGQAMKAAPAMKLVPDPRTVEGPKVVRPHGPHPRAVRASQPVQASLRRGLPLSLVQANPQHGPHRSSRVPHKPRVRLRSNTVLPGPRQSIRVRPPKGDNSPQARKQTDSPRNPWAVCLCSKKPPPNAEAFLLLTSLV